MESGLVSETSTVDVFVIFSWLYFQHTDLCLLFSSSLLVLSSSYTLVVLFSPPLLLLSYCPVLSSCPLLQEQSADLRPVC